MKAGRASCLATVFAVVTGCVGGDAFQPTRNSGVEEDVATEEAGVSTVRAEDAGSGVVLALPTSFSQSRPEVSPESSDAPGPDSGVGSEPTGVVDEPVCGNSQLEGEEECDDGNNTAGDGCVDCRIITGWRCSDEPSSCEPENDCVAAGEVCDPNATCVTAEQSSSCRCNDGFRGDGKDCSVVATQLDVAHFHSCAVLGAGSVRCWGGNTEGQLGYGNTETIGDDELPATTGFVDIGEPVTQIATGRLHTCALLQSGNVRCWGLGSDGQLGYGGRENIGDDETPAEFHQRLLTAGQEAGANVELGAPAVQIVAGATHNCALLEGGAVRCWGHSLFGQLGYGGKQSVGDNETVGEFHARRLEQGHATGANVDVGGSVTQLAAGLNHTCALLSSGAVRCWGGGARGQLGYGNTRGIGHEPGESPSSARAGDVQIGTNEPVVKLIAGGNQTCVILQSGGLRCWGGNASRQLGYTHAVNVGDKQTPAAADLGVSPVGLVSDVVTGTTHSCAVKVDGTVRCWGATGNGRLGCGGGSGGKVCERPNISVVQSLDINLLAVGESIVQLAAGNGHTCALLESGLIRCWGRGDWAQLGYGECKVTPDGQTTLSDSTCKHIGDDEDPIKAGFVPVF